MNIAIILWLFSQAPGDPVADQPPSPEELRPLSAWSEKEIEDTTYTGRLLEALPSGKRLAVWRVIQERGPRGDMVEMVRLVRVLKERLTT